MIEQAPEVLTTMADPQRAAERIAAHFASGDVPRQPASRAELARQFGVVKPRHHRRGRSEASRALAAQILDTQEGNE